MRPRSLRQLLAGSSLVLAAAAFAGCAPEAESTGDETHASRGFALGVKPGDAYTLGHVTLIAPLPGMGVVGEVVPEDGEAEIVHLFTNLEGTVFLMPEHDANEDDDIADPVAESSAEAMVESTASNGSIAPCKDKASSLLGFKWAKPYEWYFNASTTPQGVSAADAEAKLGQAAKNITAQRNSCGFADQVSATHVYRGRTSSKAQIDANGTCVGTDGQNSVSFGDLPQGTLGVACTYYAAGEAVEADVKFNKVDHKWFGTKPSGCSGRYSIEGVATHEFGHVFGLGHVTEAKHGNLTMSTAVNAACQNSEATLGRGDVIGLRKLY
jgi:hypothetical protein